MRRVRKSVPRFSRQFRLPLSDGTLLGFDAGEWGGRLILLDQQGPATLINAAAESALTVTSHRRTPDRFRTDVLANNNNRVILERWNALALPDGWLVAGCLFQTIWNIQAGRPPDENIKDYDLFYFDKDDLSEKGERAVQAHVDQVLADLGISIEVSNQARVHTWYESYFGHPYEALHSASDGIDRFLIPATCVGIRPDSIYAPNGLEMLYEGVLTTNPLTPYLDLFDQKTASYCARWPSLRVVRTTALSKRP